MCAQLVGEPGLGGGGGGAVVVTGMDLVRRRTLVSRDDSQRVVGVAGLAARLTTSLFVRS